MKMLVLFSGIQSNENALIPLLFGAAGNIWIEGMTASLQHCTADRLSSLQPLVAALKPLKAGSDNARGIGGIFISR